MDRPELWGLSGICHRAACFFPGKKKDICDVGGCNVEYPKGGWTTLLLVRGLVAAGTAVMKIFTTAAACIPALSFMAISDNLSGDEIPPSRVTVGQWTTGRTRQLFPGFGKDSQALVGGVGIEDIQNQETAQLFFPITFYTENILDRGQNNMPGIMARLNTNENQEGFGFSVNNGRPRTINYVIKLYIAYNSDEG